MQGRGAVRQRAIQINDVQCAEFQVAYSRAEQQGHHRRIAQPDQRAAVGLVEQLDQFIDPRPEKVHSGEFGAYPCVLRLDLVGDVLDDGFHTCLSFTTGCGRC